MRPEQLTNPLHTLIPQPQFREYCVWFIPEDIAKHPPYAQCVQYWQSMIVVRASCEDEAVEIAAPLLNRICLLEVKIVKVAAEFELTSALEALRKVKRGDLLPASQLDSSDDEWARFVEITPLDFSAE